MRGNGGRKLAAVLAIGLAVGAAHAQTPQELLDRARQQRQVLDAETKLEGEVSEAVRTATGLAKTFPDKALRNLKDVAGKVAGASITETKRTALLKQIDDATAAIKGTTPAADPKADAALLERILKNEKNTKVVDAAKLEAKEVNEAITGIVRDIDNRKEADAKRKLADIAAKYPDNPSVLMLQHQQMNADSISVARWISDESARRQNKAMNDVLVSAMPPLGDIEFDKDYRKRIELRKLLNAPKLTAEEQKLLKSLETPIKSGLKDAPFQEAVSLLSTAIDQKIYVDTKSLEGLGVNLDDKVDVPGGVTARSALRVMLQSKGLTFILRDNIIQVVTLDMARKQCITRAYDVRDLVSGGFGTPGPWGPYLDAQATVQNAQIIIDAIKKSVEPAAWEGPGGGVGTITFHYGTMSLIVRAPSEVHADLYRKMTK